MAHSSTKPVIPASIRIANSYYAWFGLHPSASVIEIRRAYRDLSKRYHPDTTALPQAIATAKSQQLNEAYATLSNPERRAIYDLHIGYSRLNVIQSSTDNFVPTAGDSDSLTNSAYLDSTDRPLSAGELFVLALLALAFVCCFGVAMILAWLRGAALVSVPAVVGQLSLTLSREALLSGMFSS